MVAIYISFNDALDGDSGINVAKNKIVLSEALENALEPVITKFKKYCETKIQINLILKVKKLSKEEEKFVQKIDAVADC